MSSMFVDYAGLNNMVLRTFDHNTNTFDIPSIITYFRLGGRSGTGISLEDQTTDGSNAITYWNNLIGSNNGNDGWTMLMWFRADELISGTTYNIANFGDEDYFITLVSTATGTAEIHFKADFSTTDGQWKTNAAVLPNKWYCLVFSYSHIATTTNPIINIVNWTDNTTPSISITETATPVGSFSGIATEVPVLGDQFAGDIAQVIIYDELITDLGTVNISNILAVGPEGDFRYVNQTTHPHYIGWTAEPKAYFRASATDRRNPYDISTYANAPITNSLYNDFVVTQQFYHPTEREGLPYYFGSGYQDSLAAYNAHINGPYGYSSFKQLRTHQNPLSRYQVKNNLFSIVQEPSQQVNIAEAISSNNSINYVSSRYGDLIQYNEMCVTSKYKPLLYVFGLGIDNPRIENQGILSEPNLERIIVRDSYGNEINYFGNRDLNNRLNLITLADEDYDRIKEFYLNGGLDADDSPITTFELLKYGERVWPSDVNAYKSHIRQRTTFQNNFWRSTRAARTRSTYSGFGQTYSHSMWNLDAVSDFTTRSNPATLVGFTNIDNAGILQNNYSLYAPVNISTANASTINDNLKPAPYYTRLHSLSTNESVVAPSGIRIPETGSTNSAGAIFQGTALWEAATQSGKDPFYASYDNFIDEIRPKYKDYSIIPAYTVSNHVKDFYYNGSSAVIDNVFQISGALANTTSSADDNFYKTYSTSEFLSDFAKIKRDHKGFVDPSMIKLTCKAVKKFLAYDSFYPQERTIDIAKQFWDSYSPFISSSVTAGGPKGGASVIDITKQNLLNPLFAPGVLYNSIKAGVACDYPLITGAGNLSSSYFNDDYAIMNEGGFDLRVPFEALLKPQAFLSNVELVCNEPHPSGNLSASCFWNGGGEPFYNAMVSNFCAETADFFLANGNFTYLQSKPQADPNFGQLKKGINYGMRVRMYRSMEFFNTSVVSGGVTYMPPQDVSDIQNTLVNHETITMYSRPSAFGPACGAGIHTYAPSKGSRDGYNFPFTPPYYHGQSWCDIIFKPEENKKFSLSEIINSSSYSYFRADPHAWKLTYLNGNYYRGPQGFTDVNKSAMQLSASLIVDGVADFKSNILASNTSAEGRATFSGPTEGTPRSAWTIQTRYETPILNFKDVTLTTSSANLYSGQTPRGMWHQHGRLPTGSEGIFMDVVDLPPSWLQAGATDPDTGVAYTLEEAYNFKSLGDAVGFTQTPIRLGNTANRKIISEAIVAVPYIDVGGTKKFFEIQKESINNFIKTNLAVDQKPASPTIYDMLKKMRKYNFPPNMDFLNNRDITPFAMYIFEFFHTLNEQDLADIWQGLPPDIGINHEEVEASISHPLLAKELLGGGFYNNNTRTGNTIPEKIRWMVFKVKKKAKKNYNRKILSKKGSAELVNIPNDQNYNWPYDFFSLVELAKIDAQFTFSDITLQGSSVTNAPKGREFFEKSTRTENLLSSTNNPADATSTVLESAQGTQGSGTSIFDDSPDKPQEIPPNFPTQATEFFDFEKEEDSEGASENPNDFDSNTAPQPEPEEPEI